MNTKSITLIDTTAISVAALAIWGSFLWLCVSLV